MRKILQIRNPQHKEDNIWTWRKTIPNLVTLCGSTVGFSSIYLALQGKFTLAVLAIVFAGLIDGLDGPIARFLLATSQFGAELDSLSDYVCFGVSPSLVLFLWGQQKQYPYGWIACVIFTLFIQCRLARFNAGVDFNTRPHAKNFFMGVPAPGSAGLALMPLVVHFQFGPGPWDEPRNIAIYQVLVGILAFSQLPTFSSKLLKRSMFQPIWVKILVLLGGALFFFGIYSAPWLTLLGVFSLYVLSWPFSLLVFRSLSKAADKAAAASASTTSPPAAIPASPVAASPKKNAPEVVVVQQEQPDEAPRTPEKAPRTPEKEATAPSPRKSPRIKAKQAESPKVRARAGKK